MIREKLQVARLKKGLSQEELAELLHMTQPNYSRRENGIKNISDNEWEKIAKELKVKVEDIKEDNLNNIVYKKFRAKHFCFNFGTIHNNMPDFIRDYFESVLKDKDYLNQKDDTDKK